MTYLWALPALTATLMGSNAATTAVEPPVVVAKSDFEAIAPSLSNPETEILDLENDAHQRMTLPVTIDGYGPFDFMVDTGSQATAVTYQINESLQLTPSGTATLVGMASRRSVDMVEVDNMTFGTHTVRDIVSPLLDRQHVGADGIIGLDSLQDFRVLIDFREETMTLQDVSEINGSQRGFEIIVRARPQLGQLLITDALVEGVRATVIIDTGAQSSIGNLVLRERIQTKRAQEVTTIDVNGAEIVGQMSYVKSLNIGELALTNVSLTFADAPAFEALGLQDQPVITLGMQHLKIFDRVAIDFSSQRILFDLPRDVARALRRQRRQNIYTPIR